MGNIKKFTFAVGFVIILTQQWAAAQTSVLSLFPKKRNVGEQKIDHSVYDITHNSINVSIIRYSDAEKGVAYVDLYDSEGAQIWSKKINRAKRVSTAKNSHASIVTSNRNRRDESLNTYYDDTGNKIWDIWLPGPGLTLSNDGNYAITTQVSVEEGNGSFRVFNAKEGNEITPPIPKDYSHYYSEFLDNETVVVILQRFERSRLNDDRVKNQRGLFRHKIPDDLTPEERKIEARRRLIESGPMFEISMKPLQLVIYDIPSNKILITEYLVSKNGNPLWTTAYRTGNISISGSEKRITLAVFNRENKMGPTPGPNALINLTTKGKIKWEIELPETIQSIRGFNDNYLAVLSNPETIYLIDNESGRIRWKYKHDKKGSSQIRYISVSEGKLAIQTTHYYNWKKSYLHIIDLDTGVRVEFPDFEDDQIMVGEDSNHFAVFNRTKSILLFLK